MTDRLLTLHQFYSARRAAYMAENSDVSRAAYTRSIPVDMAAHDWLESIHQAAERGETIPARILDALWYYSSAAWFSLRHDHRNCTPEDYLNPAVRALNKAHEAEMRQARRKGAA